eukprot:CCRYP_008802-RA/>CCRYP_008802-RA protein AED:0.43 eAED:0.43 QI:0/-1/0/1/-1/1/1/0/164
MGCPVIIHNKVTTRKSWNFRGREGFSIGPALLHYRCFQVIDVSTKNLVISDTVEFHHSYLHQPTVTYEDRLLHTINFLSTAISDAPANAIDTQLDAIDALRTLFAKWHTPPNVHRTNAAERAIQTFKAHFLSILTGIDPSFPNYLWDKLLPGKNSPSTSFASPH